MGYFVSYCFKCSISSLLGGLPFHNQKFSHGVGRTDIYFNPSAWDETEFTPAWSIWESVSKGEGKELHVGWVASWDEDQEISLKSQKENSIWGNGSKVTGFLERSDPCLSVHYSAKYPQCPTGKWLVTKIHPGFMSWALLRWHRDRLYHFKLVF